MNVFANKGKGKATPNRSGKTPTSSNTLGDRFIPNRSNTQFDVGYYMFNHQQPTTTDAESKPISPTQQEYQRVMKENLNGGAASCRILSYGNKPPKAPEGY